jgi:hypothetical protein
VDLEYKVKERIVSPKGWWAAPLGNVVVLDISNFLPELTKSF